MSWPGLNTRGGRLDDGTGQLEDGSINCQINRADVLSKRGGFVRGLDEWFETPVCGLFTYLDYCGQEYLLVANQDEIAIRQPFLLPQFSSSDAYPNDTFDGTGAINVSNWRNTGRYERLGGRMVQAAGTAAFTGPRLGDGLFQRWFKDAGAFSYLTEVNYVFDASLQQEQRVGIVIRGNGDLSAGALLQADVVFNAAGGYRVQLFHRESDGTYRTLGTIEVDGVTTAPSGLLTLSYVRNLTESSYVPTVSVLSNLGTFQTLVGATLTQLQDADLGLVSAIALGQKAGTLSTSVAIESVAGRPI